MSVFSKCVWSFDFVTAQCENLETEIGNTLPKTCFENLFYSRHYVNIISSNYQKAVYYMELHIVYVINKYFRVLINK